MKKQILLFLLTIGALVTFKPTEAQHTSFALSYNLAQPTGESHEWTPRFSPRGIGLEYEYFINENFSTGLYLGWQVFYTKITGEPYVIDANTQVYAAQYRYTNAFPINVAAKYYLTPDASVIPFVGFGFGTTHIIRRLDMGPFEVKEANWYMGLYPELGVKVPTDGGWNFHIAATYNYQPKLGDANLEYSWVGFKFGISWDHYR
jgi:hypothetical protein